MGKVKSDRQSMLEALIFVVALYFGVGYFAKGCAAGDKEDTVLAAVDSLEKRLHKKDSALVTFCDTMAFYFEEKRQFIYGDGDDVYIEDETPQDVGRYAAKVLHYIRDRAKEDDYGELKEIRESF